VKPLSLAFIAPHGEGALRSRLGERTALGFGGAEIQMALLGTGLAARGHQVSFLCTGRQEEIQQESLDGIRLIRLPMGGVLGRSPAGGIQGWLRRGLDTAGADIVYQRCALPLTGRLAWACAGSGRSFVFAVANDRDVDGRIRQVMGMPRYLMYRYGFNRADLVVVQSQHQLEQLSARRRKRSLLLSSVFDMEGVQPAVPEGTPQVIWVGNILAKKRPEELLSMARNLPGVKFVAAGSATANAKLGAEFTRQAARLGNLEYVGQVPHAQMGELYDGASILLNTSSAEGMPNTFLEAWARGIPVATMGIDPDGLLSRERLGILLDPANAAGSLESLVADDLGRKEMGQRGREYVRTTHALPAVLDRLEQELSSLGE
jgi:glycosyltransferase involved in cell wall biosynthesis